MIYHIYWGTSGNSGLYLDEIYQVLENAGYRQRAFVNYYYPFDYGDKLFFKHGDIAYGNVKGKLRKIVQLLEVLKGYVVILCCASSQKPKVINYSHAGQSYFFVHWFLSLLKFISGAKLVITCHDVMPFGSMSSEMKYRKKIFHCADNLLVHNSNSIKELQDNFGINPSIIVQHPFPIMDLSKLMPNAKKVEKDIDFLFIGHLRSEKGIDFLLDAWQSFYETNKEARLRVCGRKLASNTFDEKELSKYNIDFDLRFIPDDDYFQLVSRAKYVLLPYIKGTNSGIISTVLSLGANVITSDLPMFKENPLVVEDCMFRTGDKKSLVDKLQEKWLVDDTSSSTTLSDYRDRFKKEVIETYNYILNNMY